ncbi:MAG: Do family serine endopeptidase [Deltaproteobacteria bacterium]|nr:Do family serine endopeptidase [Deltaproteobacteria bacterium]
MKFAFSYTKNRKMAKVMSFMFVGMVVMVACGASGKKKTDNPTNSDAPLSPVTYNPAISLSPLVEKVSPAVVNVKTSQSVKRGMGFGGPQDFFEFFFGQRGQNYNQREEDFSQKAMGSGFIIDKKGLVVTNNHVVEGADHITVTVGDDNTYEATIVGRDEKTDLALLKLKGASNLPTVKFGSSSSLKVGDTVVAIGNPFGLDHTVTSGIVSAKERVIGAGPYDNFIQTDASINPGNSGGPLFNLSGEVVGVNTAISRTGQGIGFAIPSDMARDLVDHLKNGGKVIRGWLGLVFQPLDDNLTSFFGAADNKGALVSKVMPGSPADLGGIVTKDIIVGVDGKKLGSSSELPKIVAMLKPGKTVTFDILRNKKMEKRKIKIGTMPEDGSMVSRDSNNNRASDSLPGISVVPLDSGLRGQLGIDSNITGVVVSQVGSNGKLGDSIRRGDVITEVNGNSISSVNDYNAAINGTKKGDDILLKLFRSGGWLYLVIRI